MPSDNSIALYCQSGVLIIGPRVPELLPGSTHSNDSDEWNRDRVLLPSDIWAYRSSLLQRIVNRRHDNNKLRRNIESKLRIAGPVWGYYWACTTAPELISASISSAEKPASVNSLRVSAPGAPVAAGSCGGVLENLGAGAAW